HQHFVPLVVCSRNQEYVAQQLRLSLHNAAIVRPLAEQQIDEYFMVAGKILGGLRSLVRSNTQLYELITTPLILQLFTLTYQGISMQDLQKSGDLEKQRRIFDQYIQQRLEQQGDDPPFSVERTKCWLSWLAGQMRQR